jgi:excinuclease ABC subunit C
MVIMQSDLSNIPKSPGVYLMKNKVDEIIYIGKARDLKKRLGAYFKDVEKMDVKTRVMAGQIDQIETIVTTTEKEAFLLESTLIRRHRPKYNVDFKDDKRYPSLRVDKNSPYPNIRVVRKRKKDGALYFGPYVSSHAVNQTLQFIHKTFKLRKCKSPAVKNRSRPCLNHQIESCLAPCCLPIDPAEYDDIVNEVILFLKGNTKALIRKLKRDMQIAAEHHEYEKAASLRDRIFSIQKTVEKQNAVTSDRKNRDIIAVAQSPEISLITVMAVRDGRLLGSNHYRFKETISNEKELIGFFIREYYDKKLADIPDEILVQHHPEDAPFLEELLNHRKEKKVKISFPQRGEKRRLIHIAARNAEARMKEKSASAAADAEMARRLQKKLKTKALPLRIECVDNSNISGKDPVAGLVVFQNGRPEKASYRRYKIKKVTVQNDYGYLKEVLERRFRKGNRLTRFPDLLMIDGGRGHLNISLAILKERGLLGLFDVIAIAKPKKEKSKVEETDKIYTPGRVNPIAFGREEDLLLYLQRIRDEAHRFAVTFHRQRRQKTSMASILDTINGIGEKRKAVILKKFGSIKKIRAATVEELRSLPGMNQKAAEAVIHHLKNEL